MGAERFLQFMPTKKKGKVPVGSDPNAPSLFAGTQSYRIEYAGGVGPIAQSMLPDDGWKPTNPDEWPDLSDSAFISIDIESHDPCLNKKGPTGGPGFLRKEAEVIGVAITAESRSGVRWSDYLPIAHRCGGLNLPADRVYQFIRDACKTQIPKVGANLLYDMEGLWLEGGVHFQGQILDVQNAEGILDEESAFAASDADRGFSLNKLAKRYLGERKKEDFLAQARVALKVKKDSDVKKRLRDLPPQCGVARYAIADTTLALDILKKQLPEIQRQDLGRIWKLECDLVPILLKMRLKGVRIDLGRAQQVSQELKRQQDVMLAELAEVAGRPIDPWKNADLKALAEAVGVPVMLTEAGNASFTKKWLTDQKLAVFDKTNEIRELEKFRRDFIDGTIISGNINGRLHASFHQLRRDKDADSEDAGDGEQGTRSGRFSSTNPNLQQIPKRNKKFAPLIRAMFLPEEGKKWVCGDYAGQENRLLAHFSHKAGLAGMLSDLAARAAADLVQAYCADPLLDYHQKVADMTSLIRDIAKPLNLMLVYGAGQRKVAFTTGWITEAQFRDVNFKLPPEVTKFFDIYHAGVPFVKEMLKITGNLASARGWVSTILGRRKHFDFWEPKQEWGEKLRKYEPMPLAQARNEWPDRALIRSDVRKALNNIIQGSGADMNKKAIVDLDAAGITIQLTVHDEADTSISTPNEARTFLECMRDSTPLLLPVIVDMGVGNHWAEANSKAGKEEGERWLAAAA